MPNIAITTYCNLHCPYCFANNMIDEEQIKNIDLQQFSFILNWIKQTPEYCNHIGIIGGEPTLHPQFSEILNILKNFSDIQPSHFILFTNGIELLKYIDIIPKNMNILINVNTPDAMTQDQFLKMKESILFLDKIGWTKSRATLGCNLCLEIDDYSFFWDIVNQCSNVDIIRMSVTSPSIQYRKNKKLYYLSMKKRTLKFFSLAKKYNKKISLDCNQIPSCYFTENELRLINDVVVENKLKFCQPVIDITPDFQASACFGAYDLVDCKIFNNLNELKNYLFLVKMNNKRILNYDEQCQNCKLYQYAICQGGCLAFSKEK